jgi:hypothetical protein
MYNIKEFIKQCNISPLLIDYRKRSGDISHRDLENIGFVKEDYNPIDIFTLKESMSGFQSPEEPKMLKKVRESKRSAKDLRHEWLIKNLDNQRIIMDARKFLEMKFENRGFLMNKVAQEKEPIFELYENYTNLNFDFSPEFESWFFRNSKDRSFDEWEKASALNREKITITVNDVISKWKLPQRYEKAIRELILFNRIIPAASGISWTLYRDSPNEDFKRSICFDTTTTKQELINSIKEERYHFKRNKGSTFRIKSKSSQKKSIINDYNLRKKTGRNDNLIYQELGHKYGLSCSGIRKNIKGN